MPKNNSMRKKKLWGEKIWGKISRGNECARYRAVLGGGAYVGGGARFFDGVQYLIL